MNAAARQAALTNLVPPAALLGAILLVFGQCAAFEWTNWDDQLHVTENAWLQQPSLSQLVEFWRGPYGRLYIPVSYTLFSLESEVGRWLFSITPPAVPPATVFHVTSIALHATCVFLVWRLLIRLVGKPWPAAVGALLFGIHPLQVETVAWISEQRGLLAALFSLLSLACHLRACRGDAAPDRRWSGAAFAAFVAAVLSKPSAMTLPLTAAMIDLFLLRRPWKHVAITLTPWCAVSLFTAVGTKLLQPDATIFEQAPSWLRPLVAGDALAFYGAKLFMPLQLGIDYGRTPARVLHDFPACVCAIGMYGVLALLLLLPALRSWRLPVVLFLIPLLPVLGFVPFAFQHISTVADRYIYFAMLGPALGVSLLLTAPDHAPPLAPSVAAFVVFSLSLLAIGSFSQAQSWRNCETLYAQALLINPASHHAHNNLGTALLDAGQPERAVDPLLAAVALKPDYAKAHYNLATALHQLGQSTPALTHYAVALQLNPGHADAHNNLGILLAQQGRTQQAIDHFQEALANRRDFLDARRNLENAREQLRAVTGGANTE